MSVSLESVVVKYLEAKKLSRHLIESLVQRLPYELKKSEPVGRFRKVMA